MSSEVKATADPSVGVARVSVATSFGQPGGHVLGEADVPRLLSEGASYEEIAALQLTSLSRLDEIVRELVDTGQIPSERFSFRR